MKKLNDFYMGYSEKQFTDGSDITYEDYIIEKASEVYVVEGRDEEDVINLVTIRNHDRYDSNVLSESNKLRRDLMFVDGNDYIDKFNYDREEMRESIRFIKEVRIEAERYGEIYRYHLIKMEERVGIITFHKKSA